MEVYDVVVVGAGPIGLATAVGLYQRGINNILVVDQTRAFRSVGQVIDLLPNGLKALKMLNMTAFEAVKEAVIKRAHPPQTTGEEGTTPAPNPAQPSRQWVQRNLQGRVIHAFSLDYEDWVKEHGEGRLSIRWYDLQTTLRNQLPPDRVRANHRCINLVNDPQTGWVRIDCVSDAATETNPYAHWIDVPQLDNTAQGSSMEHQSMGVTSVHAKLVVAADGINSTIRQALYRDTPYQVFAQPEYSGFAAVGCFAIQAVPAKLRAQLQETFLEDSPIATIVNDERDEDLADGGNPRMILVGKPDGSFGYLLHLPLPLAAVKELSGYELVELAMEQLKQADFPESLQQVVQFSVPAQMISRPYYIHRVAPSDSISFPKTACLHPLDETEAIQLPWRVGRVILAGDAVHGMPPFRAQGANQGLEDAFVIATLISRIRDQQAWNDAEAIAGAFEIYERLRRPLMAWVQKATVERYDLSETARQAYEQQVYQRHIAQELEIALGE